MILDTPPKEKDLYRIYVEPTAKILKIQDIFSRLEQINLWFLPFVFTLYWVQALFPSITSFILEGQTAER